MPEWMLNWVEFQNWGWNTLTISFIATVVVTLVETWGIYQQAKTIWKNPEKRGESVSTGLFTYLTAMFTVSAIYGAYKNTLAMLFTGIILGALHIPIIVGLWKFKGFAQWEKLLGLLSIGVVIGAFFTTDLDIYLLTINVGTAFFLLLQPYEIWKNKNSGVVEIRLLLVYLIGTFFWVIYSFAVDKWVLKILNLNAFAILILTTVLWFKYRQKPNKIYSVLHTDPI